MGPRANAHIPSSHLHKKKKKRNVIQGYWLCHVAMALPSTDTASSTELNTAGRGLVAVNTPN